MTVYFLDFKLVALSSTVTGLFRLYTNGLILVISPCLTTNLNQFLGVSVHLGAFHA